MTNIKDSKDYRIKKQANNANLDLNVFIIADLQILYIKSIYFLLEIL